MKLTDRPRSKILICAVLALAGLLAVAGGSYAAYTSQDAQRAVVRNRDTEAIRFTSNYLQTCANGTSAAQYAGRTILFDANVKKQDSVVFDIDIYNYVKGNTSLVSERDITYDLTLTFEGGQGGYVVNGHTVTGDTYTEKGVTLKGRMANSSKYTISIPGADIDNLKITATAIPTKLSVTNNQILAAIILPCTESKVNVFSYQGTFTDASSDTVPADYDAFNYEVSISSGKADVTLTWDPEAVEIDQYFLKKIGKGDISPKAGSVTFEMDQDNGTGNYRIPFYIVSKCKIAADWDGMKELIKVHATKK